MPGSRCLTSVEERLLVRRIRSLGARDRVIITAQLFTGFRISEILSLTIGHVFHDGRVRERIGLRPGLLKGHYGSTRWIPVTAELKRALENYLPRRAKKEELSPTAPLFLSREHDSSGHPKALSRSGAEKLIRRVLRSVAQGDAQALSTHSLRKTWARRLWEQSGHNILMVRDGLGHGSVAVTQAYLSADRERLDELVLAGDWTHRPRKKKNVVVAEIEPSAQLPAPTPAPQAAPTATSTDFLPGFESLAA
jgi:integrase